jgi:hypothetical protein
MREKIELCGSVGVKQWESAETGPEHRGNGNRNSNENGSGRGVVSGEWNECERSAHEMARMYDERRAREAAVGERGTSGRAESQGLALAVCQPQPHLLAIGRSITLSFLHCICSCYCNLPSFALALSALLLLPPCLVLLPAFYLLFPLLLSPSSPSPLALSPFPLIASAPFPTATGLPKPSVAALSPRPAPLS